MIAPDELLDYKGVHMKLGSTASRFTTAYGRFRAKQSTNAIEKFE